MNATTRVFFVGASGTGKSTLGNAIAAELRLPFLSISPSVVYRQFGVTIAECLKRPSEMARVQAGIADYTAECLERVGSDPGYVTDRAYDLSVYGALLGCAHPEEKVRRVLNAMTDGEYPVRTLTFFVRPAPAVLERARAEDGGRRGQFLTDEWVYRVDGALAYFIATKRLTVVELPAEMSDLGARLARVRRACGLPAPSAAGVRTASL